MSINPLEMERVIRAAGWLYCGAHMWRRGGQDRDPVFNRCTLEAAYARVMRK
jgi:hypothetical protein